MLLPQPTNKPAVLGVQSQAGRLLARRQGKTPGDRQLLCVDAHDFRSCPPRWTHTLPWPSARPNSRAAPTSRVARHHSRRWIDHRDLAATVVEQRTAGAMPSHRMRASGFLPVLLISPVNLSVLGSKTVIIPRLPVGDKPLADLRHHADAVHAGQARDYTDNRTRSRIEHRHFGARARRTAAGPVHPSRGSRSRRLPVSGSSATRGRAWPARAPLFLPCARLPLHRRNGRWASSIARIDGSSLMRISRGEDNLSTPILPRLDVHPSRFSAPETPPNRPLYSGAR